MGAERHPLVSQAAAVAVGRGDTVGGDAGGAALAGGVSFIAGVLLAQDETAVSTMATMAARTSNDTAAMRSIMTSWTGLSVLIQLFGLSRGNPQRSRRSITTMGSVVTWAASLLGAAGETVGLRPAGSRAGGGGARQDQGPLAKVQRCVQVPPSTGRLRMAVLGM